MRHDMRNLAGHAPWPRGLLRWAAALLLTAMLWLPGGPANAAITLAEMTATAQPNGSILVRWVTGTEFNSSKFILYRSENPDGPWDFEIHRQVASDLGGITGATYIFEDVNVVLNTTYYYVLGELEKNGNLVKYPEARTSATAGQVLAATATASPTPTRTATATATPLAGATGTATATQAAPGGQPATATPSQTPPATRPPAEQPTATRRFTNTPRPAVSATPGLPAGVTAIPTLVRADAATPALGAIVSTPILTPQPGVVLLEPAPTASPIAPAAEALVATSTPAAASATDDPAGALTAEATVTPRTFGPAAGDQPLLGTAVRPQPQSTPAPANQAGRNSRLFLLLGGVAIGLAALLGGAAFAIWRRRQR